MSEVKQTFHTDCQSADVARKAARAQRGGAVDRCVKLRLRFGSRPQSFFEKPDDRQQNHLPDDGVNDLCDDAADENKAGQWQKPTCQDDPIMPTTMLNSKTVTLDELGLRAVPATPTMISQIMTSIGMTVPPRYADTSPAFPMFVLWFIKASRVGRRSVKGNYPPRTPAHVRVSII